QEHDNFSSYKSHLTCFEKHCSSGMATIKKEDDDGINLHGITSEAEGAFVWPTKFEDLKNEVSKLNQSVISICTVKLKKGNRYQKRPG
ncbi:hypothetical protein LTS18_013418, partial [Coniosporium uncinatum]